MNRRLGVAVVGLGGAVATTAAAGIELLRAGMADHTGLPLAGIAEAELAGLVPYEQLVFGGWDLNGADLAKAADIHRVLSPHQVDAVADRLAAIIPWPAVGSLEWCRNVGGDNQTSATGWRAQIAAVVEQLAAFRIEESLDSVVMIHLASTERSVDVTLPAFADIEAFEQALDRDDPAISPANIYAYAAITSGVPHVNFTPSTAADVPALVALAEQRGVPIAGKDGKTGQTLIKTVLAPALRDRALTVEGWFSTNILGNRDGLALEDADSLASKVETKRAVLDGILGYEVEDHLVDIRYYRRGCPEFRRTSVVIPDADYAAAPSCCS